ncbi:tetraspanin-8-like [Andrographis paniculata]|uniref:tetraspanin-8-like n=1 Tax=Andrographis paniculata TaxID=175694 RepID=UPI0021E987A0|nr:tetraspanin-8-like [Andrographis paniculata]
MAHVSNCLLAIFNLLSLLLSIPMVVAAAWAWRVSATHCGRFLQAPLVTLSVAVLVISAAGLLGAALRLTWLTWAYMAAMSAAIAGIMAATALALAVVREGRSGVEAIPGKAYVEFRAEGYSEWLRNRVFGHWDTMKRCLIQENICRSMADDHAAMSAREFYSKPLNPLQSGCCKPPNECKFEYVSPTKWRATDKSSTAKNNTINPDCGAWSNDDNILCYNCESCKGAMLFQLNLSLMKFGAVGIIILSYLIIVFAVGCCALRNNRKQDEMKNGQR